VPTTTDESALVVVVDVAEPAVGCWRSRYDRSCAVGVPPHVTVLYPFLPPAAVTADVLDALAAIFTAEPAFDVVFPGFGRFPGGVLWLAPDPAEPFRRLTHAIWRAWPQAPPYGGAHTQVTPHLTVAEHPDDDLLDAIAADVAPALPLSARVTSGQLLAVGATDVSLLATFALG
jgi:2'-5' RNA ligase